MFLNIILTILVLVLIGITALVIFWWRKYGKKIFNTVSNIKSKNDPQLKQNIGNINNAFADLGKAMDMLKKYTKWNK